MLKLFKERYAIYKGLGRYIKNVKSSIIVTLVARLMIIPLDMGVPFLFSVLVGRVMVDKNIELLKLICLGYVGIFAVRSMVDLLEFRAFNRIKNRFIINLRKTMWNNCLNLSFNEYIKKDVGSIKMTLDEDITKISEFIKLQITEYIFHILMAVVHLVVILYISPLLAVICLAFIPLVFFTNIQISKGTGKINEEMRKVGGENYSWQFNTLQRWKEIKALNAEKKQYKKFLEFRHKIARLGIKWILFWFLNEVFDFFKYNMLSKILIYILGATFVLHGQLTIGTLILFIQYFGTLFNSLNSINQKDAALKADKPYYDRVLQMIVERPVLLPKFKNHKLTGDIKIEGVSFKYNKEQEDILKDFSLYIANGDYIAITGKSGCGKSTLVNLIANLYKADSGVIEYDGLSADEISENDFYSNIGFMMQDSYLFNMSIKENLLLAKPKATDKELCAICDNANILDFIESLPEKFDTIIGERGIKLSGGQKQRLVIAQVLLKKPRIVIFDEATSSLDHLSEQKIHKALQDISEQCTVIVIAHRKSSIMAAKKVIVMDNVQMLV